MSADSETHDIFIIGLRNAHAMENQALSILRPQLARTESYPEVAERIQRHIVETEAQEKRLEALLDMQGEGNSAFKDIAASVVGGMATLGHAMADDEILKNSFANYAFENFEIAAYRSLLTLADALGHRDAISVLQQNLAEEEAMAAWIAGNLASVTLQYAELREAGLTAKR
jgi:ferritin-like metal-binding protein YciE